MSTLFYEQPILIRNRELTVTFDVEIVSHGSNARGDRLNPPEYMTYDVSDATVYLAVDSDGMAVELSDDEKSIALDAMSEERAISEYEQ